ncbi:MbcA/ParS/Xre antitoxin family protein [Undibacterium sp. Di27W]
MTSYSKITTRHETNIFMSMHLENAQRPAGRPTKTTVSKIKTLAWIRFIASISQKTPSQLGREFHPTQYRYDGEKQQSSKRWERYAEGSSSPPDLNSGDSLVDLVDRAYPGSAKLFRHSVWIALEGNLRDSREINALLLTLGELVTDICFIPQEVRGKTKMKRVPYDYGLPMKLANLRSLEGLTALLLLAKEAEIIGNGKVHVQITGRISQSLFYVREIPEISFVLKEVVECINIQLQAFKYHLGGEIVVAAPRLIWEAIVGNGEDFWLCDENTPLELKLLERLVKLFSSTEMLKIWLTTFHPTLGEPPADAMQNVEGLRAVQMLLEA